MTQFKIDKNVPMPTARLKYPFGKMEVGDSFAVEVTTGKTANQQNRLATAAGVWSRRYGGKYASRVVEEGGKKYVRVWRVE